MPTETVEPPSTGLQTRARVLSVATALPPYRYPQAELTATVADTLGLAGPRREFLERLHASAGVEHRNLALPLTEYGRLGGFDTANEAYIRVGLELAAEAITQALDQAGLAASDVDLLTSTTVTGIAVPSLDARLAGPLGLRADVRRMPLVGLGCVGGAAGLARASDHLAGHPRDVAVLLSVELCSLTIQGADHSTANLVASGLFGDGAAAVVLVGREHPLAGSRGVGVLASRSRLYPDTQRVMGWDVGSSGFTIVLGAEVPDLVRANLRADVEDFLGPLDLSATDIDHWVAHPGGPKVIDALTEALGLEPVALSATRRSLADVGNMSSASVLHVLGETLAGRNGTPGPQPGQRGLLLALGPGFCLETVLLEA